MFIIVPSDIGKTDNYIILKAANKNTDTKKAI